MKFTRKYSTDLAMSVAIRFTPTAEDAVRLLVLRQHEYGPGDELTKTTIWESVRAELVEFGVSRIWLFSNITRSVDASEVRERWAWARAQVVGRWPDVAEEVSTLPGSA